jgi:hypothetical protein
MFFLEILEKNFWRGNGKMLIGCMYQGSQLTTNKNKIYDYAKRSHLKFINNI